MKGGMLNRVTQAPLSEPRALPTATKVTMPAAIASQAGAQASGPAVAGHHGGAEHAGDGEVRGRREVDAGDDQDEGLADRDDEQRHHRAQDVAPGVGAPRSRAPAAPWPRRRAPVSSSTRYSDSSRRRSQEPRSAPRPPRAAASTVLIASACPIGKRRGGRSAAPPRDHGLLPFLVQTM